jgi:hypothetical protein
MLLNEIKEKNKRNEDTTLGRYTLNFQNTDVKMPNYWLREVELHVYGLQIIMIIQNEQTGGKDIY